MTILFWDIDLTLLTTARAGMLAWDDACRAVTGRPVDLEMPTAGLPDHHVGAAILRHAGADETDATLARLVSIYEQQLSCRLPERRGRVLAQVRDVLDYLAAHRPDVRSMLLTGNTRAGARAKLTHYGLQDYFSDGAFSEDRSPRTAIAVRARDMVRLAHGEIGASRMFVIGDTPHDVDAGLAIGARTIAVATGVHTREALLAHGAWVALDQLPPPDEFERLIDMP